MVLVQEGHGVFFSSGGVFCSRSPGKECNDDGVGVFCVLPSVVDDSGEFALVVGWVVGDANALDEKTRVVGKVKGTG